MTEVDLWYLVLLKLGFSFKESVDLPFSDAEYMSYSTWYIDIGRIDYKFFFNKYTGEVIQFAPVSISVSWFQSTDSVLFKDVFYDKYSYLFREVKLDKLI